MTRLLFRMLLTGLLALYGAASSAELVVVANPRSGVDRLTRDEVINIFLGRFRQLPSQVTAHPADLPASQIEKANFYRLLVDKDLGEINSYWARLVFAGRTVPPRQTTGNEDLLSFVANTPGAVGYVDRSRVDGRVKIVFELGSR